MYKSYVFSETVWNDKQTVIWWNLHKNDAAPRCGNLNNKALTMLIPYVTLEREVM